MDSATFLQRLHPEVYPGHLEIPARAAASLYSVLGSRIGEDEVNRLMHALPYGMRELLSARQVPEEFR